MVNGHLAITEYGVRLLYKTFRGWEMQRFPSLSQVWQFCQIHNVSCGTSDDLKEII